MSSQPPAGAVSDAADSSESLAMEGIRALDPSFARFNDLETMPEAEAFKQLVMKGNTLTEAFRLARFDTLAERRADEAYKNALSRAYNRSHLSATAVNDVRAAAIPAETLEMYRRLQPGLREDEYRAHYFRHNHKR